MDYLFCIAVSVADTSSKTCYFKQLNYKLNDFSCKGTLDSRK